ELVILPESNFPLYINMFPALVQQLKMLSYRIVIVTGGLYADGDDPYNATYHFEDGKLTIAKKMVLVPFGEYIPLPGFLRDWMSDVFFNGAQEYKTADRPTDFMIKDIKVRNAICYEGTCEAFYEDGTKYLIVTSNNSWFTPSIEPVLQSLLMTLYAKRHHVTVLHSANQSKSEIINY
ncbi:MAG: apolipoprotein N-acyltransferase, partial [Thiovulaceae bacterium]|nr:apolipoprotein N-acyltransferase [Sulfurimonadaceae bacterium]